MCAFQGKRIFLKKEDWSWVVGSRNGDQFYQEKQIFHRYKQNLFFPQFCYLSAFFCYFIYLKEASDFETSWLIRCYLKTVMLKVLVNITNKMQKLTNKTSSYRAKEYEEWKNSLEVSNAYKNQTFYY